MRQLQPFVGDPLISSVEQIKIDGSRNILQMIPLAAEQFFDPDELLKLARGIAVILEFDHRV